MSKTVYKASHISVAINGHNIIKDASLEVFQGELIGIIGPNGSGKSTFLKALRGILELSEGTVEIQGDAIGNLEEKEIARRVAYMQQHNTIDFGYTAKEIVLTARYPYLKWWENEKASDNAIVEQSMKYTGVWQYKDTKINEVSGGERQRIFLAKTLAQNTDILFLDEPTAALDLVYADEIFRHCVQLCQKGKTILFVVHDLEMAAKFCTRLVLFKEGKIVGDGTPKDVLTSDNLQYAFGLHASVYEDSQYPQLRIYIHDNTRKES